jgi:large subunit ribosomal protein L13e
MSKDIEVPRPIVQAPLRKELPVKLRTGRGFSVPELNAVGLDVKKARKLGLKVDERRDSCHEENVKALKEFLAKTPQSRGPTEVAQP